MGNSYVDGKVREALMAAKGSRGMAQQLLMTWAAEDPQLLLGIAQPFLKAIAAAAIERGARGLGGGNSGAGGRAATSGGMRSGGGLRPNTALSREALESVLSRMGQDPAPSPAPSPASAPARPGTMRSATAAINAPGGNVSHEKAMMAIAKAFVAKKVR